MPGAETEEVLAIAREWADAAEGGQIGGGPFSQFIAIWIAFNALYSLRFARVGGDRRQIFAFSTWKPAAQLHVKLLQLSDYQHSINILAERGVYNSQSGKNEPLADATDLKQVLLCAYLVRCNLFHGRKTAALVRDRELTEAARLIVHRLVHELLSNTAIWDEAV